MTIELKSLTADVWEIIAANTTKKVIRPVRSTSQYIYTSVRFGDPKPTDELSAALAPFNKDSKISDSNPIDIYVKSKGADGEILVMSEIDETVKQDNASPILDVYLSQKLKEDITLTEDTEVGAEPGNFVFNVSPGHGFTAGGEWLEIWENGAFAQAEVEAVATNAITVAMPMERIWTTGAVVRRVNVDLKVDGTVPTKFTFAPFDVKWDMTRFILNMNHAAAGDDSKFGSLPALSGGVYARKKKTAAGTFGNLFNAKINADLRERAFDLTYSDKAGSGIFGTGIRRSFNGDDKNGAVVRIDGIALEEVEVWVRDILTALLRFRITLQGSAVSG